jgi:glc operon protein GlcG
VNFCFGGRAGNVLFITTDTAVWAATLAATGVAPLAAQQIRSGSGTKELRMTTIRTRRVIDEAGVDSVLRAAEQHARAKGYRVVITVVDRAGNVLALRRTPGAQVASSVVAVDKARTAAIFVRPSRDIEQQVSSGRLGALALHGAAALTGGIPLRADGEVVGAIGTSGETPDQDESVSLAGAAVSFTTTEVPALSYETARRVAETVGTVATGRGVAPVVAVVDAEGHLVYLWRPDTAQVASVGVATDKARTAAIYRRPSKDFEDQAAGGRPSALHLARAVPLQGGMPLLVDGHVIGAVGVSGASSADEDQELAVLGSEAPSPHNAATYIPKHKVHEQFQTGGLLLQTSSYKLDAGRRTGPGAVELHDHETDIMHVVHGRATVATGEDKHLLNEGDVLVIPNGVPHQFVHVTAPFFYFVTKVQS